MRSGPAGAAALILSDVRLDAPPRDVRDILADFIVAKAWCAIGDDPYELVDKWLSKVLSRISQELSTCAELGRFVRINFSSVSTSHIQGACFIEEADTAELKESKRRRSKNTEMMAVLSGLTPDEFELICGGIISIMGAEDVRVTRHSADDGIDFFGKLRVGPRIDGFGHATTIYQQLNVWMVGQAKRYVEINVDVGDIRSIVGSVTLAVGGASGSKSSMALSDLKIRPMEPVFAMLLTSGFLSSNAWRLVQQSGVIGVDGEMISELLCEHRVGEVDGEISKDAVVAWASTFKVTIDESTDVDDD